MEVTTKELRIRPGKIIEQVTVGQEITITYRGKPLAKIIPFKSIIINDDDTTIFGMWNNYNAIQTVEEQIRNLRKGRQF